MTGQASVTIDSRQWAVSVASTIVEVSSGLSGVAGMAAGTGMLFDLGYDRSNIQIDMSRMLFALDIVFISSSGIVVGVLHDVQPGEGALFAAQASSGARYFLEVNAGEAEVIEVGDSVSIVVSGQENNGQMLDLNTIMYYMIMIMMMSMMMKVMTKELKPAVERPLIYGPRGEIISRSSSGQGTPKTESERRTAHLAKYGSEEVPERGSGLEHHSIHGPERKKLVDKYGTWSVGRAEAVCAEDDVPCVEREAARLLGAYRSGYMY